MISDAFTALHEREWDRLARPGTWLTGEQRVDIARAARGETEPDGPLAVAARRVYDSPATITQPWIAELEAGGMALLEYVELLGLTARLRALDSLVFGHEQPLWELPSPVAGAPSREGVAARIDGGWVPTIGVAFPTTVLSAVPTENDAMDDVHGVLYLAPSGDRQGFSMGNMQVVRDGLGRSQMEFVAARTSLLNDCFF